MLRLQHNFTQKSNLMRKSKWWVLIMARKWVPNVKFDFNVCMCWIQQLVLSGIYAHDVAAEWNFSLMSSQHYPGFLRSVELSVAASQANCLISSCERPVVSRIWTSIHYLNFNTNRHKNQLEGLVNSSYWKLMNFLVPFTRHGVGFVRHPLHEDQGGVALGHLLQHRSFLWTYFR